MCLRATSGNDGVEKRYGKLRQRGLQDPAMPVRGFDTGGRNQGEIELKREVRARCNDSDLRNNKVGELQEKLPTN